MENQPVLKGTIDSILSVNYNLFGEWMIWKIRVLIRLCCARKSANFTDKHGKYKRIRRSKDLKNTGKNIDVAPVLQSMQDYIINHYTDELLDEVSAAIQLQLVENLEIERTFSPCRTQRNQSCFDNRLWFLLFSGNAVNHGRNLLP